MLGASWQVAVSRSLYPAYLPPHPSKSIQSHNYMTSQSPPVRVGAGDHWEGKADWNLGPELSLDFSLCV